MTAPAGRWNHNIHYHPVPLEGMPTQCGRALDVGCGEGTLARRLRRSVAHVSAIDLDEKAIEIARKQEPRSPIDYIVGDFISFPFRPASFDFVVCIAALHHMNAEAALQRMAELLRPGGALAVLGLARSRYPTDLARDAAGAIASRAYRLRRKAHWHSPAPTAWPPPHTYSEIQALAERTLKQARFRRHLLWRYSIAWTKPVTQALYPVT